MVHRIENDFQPLHLLFVQAFPLIKLQTNRNPLKQMCGINGLLLATSDQNAASELYESLGLLQHRGQVNPSFLPISSPIHLT